MPNHEPLSNMGWCCPEHTPKPDPYWAKLPAHFFVGLSVKRAFAPIDVPATEHMWLVIDGVTPEGLLTGILDNDPFYDVGMVCGDRALVHPSQIEDVSV